MNYLIKKSSIVFLISIVTFSLFSCEENDVQEAAIDFENLTILTSTVSKKKMIYGESTLITVEFSDKNQEDLKVNWISSGGEFTLEKNNQAIWKAPSKKGNYTIKAILTYKGRSQIFDIGNVSVIGAYYDPMEKFSDKWYINSKNSVYIFTEKKLEVIPKFPGAATESKIMINEIFDESSVNNLPQSTLVTIQGSESDFTDIWDDYSLSYTFKAPNTLKNKYIKRLIVRFYPSSKKFYIFLEVYNTLTDKLGNLLLAHGDLPDSSWNENETNEVGFQITKNHRLKLGLNSIEIFDTIINIDEDTTISDEVLFFTIGSDKKINISEVKLDNTSTSLFEHEKLVEF